VHKQRTFKDFVSFRALEIQFSGKLITIKSSSAYHRDIQNIQGCQMVYFLGVESVVIFSGHLEYYTTIWYILWLLGNFVILWYIFPRFVILYQERYGNLISFCLPMYIDPTLMPWNGTYIHFS
jgi:hypothetical protein